jgi:prepilin-type N-terminal cleavage/methylation domain-containing protein
MIKKIKKIFSADSGSTLVELLMALSIFAIFISVAIGGFIQSLANQRVVLKLSAATDNLSLTLEQIMREMRTGTNFLTGDGGKTIQFDRYDSEGGVAVRRTVTYSLAPAPWDPTRKALMRTLSDAGGSGGVPEAITADNVDVSYFGVSALAQHNPGPCRIALTFGVTAVDKGISVTNYIQTSVSSRAFTETCQ